MFTPTNPYIELAELLDELKMKSEDASAADVRDDLLRSIQNASRWVDDYTRRDYFFHDHAATPIEFDQFDSGVYGRDLFLPVGPIITVTKVELNGTELDAATEYVVKNTREDDQRIVALFGDWMNHRCFRNTTRNVIKVYGTFGYLQTSSFPVTVAGDTGSQLSAVTLLGDVEVGTPLYWRLTRPATNVSKLELFSDSGMTAKIAEGQTETGDTSIYCAAVNGSGVYCRAEISYTADDTDAANTFTPGAGTYSAEAVPANLPGKIKISTRLVAAVLSGRYTKDFVGMTGAKESITQSEIPKTVLQLLGRKAPILV